MMFYHLSSVDEIVEFSREKLGVEDFEYNSRGVQFSGRHIHVSKGDGIASAPQVHLTGKFSEADKAVYVQLRKRFRRERIEVILATLGPDYL